MKIADLIHFQNKLELPYRAHLKRLQNNDCSSEADILHSKIQLAEYTLLKAEIKSHIVTRHEIIKLCESVLAGTYDIDYNNGATSIDENTHYSTACEYLSAFIDEDLKHFSPELSRFAQFVPQMDEILSEGLDKFFPGLKFGRNVNGEWQSMDKEDVAHHRQETFTDNKQKAFKVLTHNEAIDKAIEIITSGAKDLKRLIHILQYGSDLTLIENAN